MKCTDCKYCIEEDQGHSNYTAEGTRVDCLLRLNPAMPVDRFYKEEPALQFADSCLRFSAGYTVLVDCEHEKGDYENYSDDPEIKLLLAAY